MIHFSDLYPDFKVTIIRRQITDSRPISELENSRPYKIELYFQWPTNRKSRRHFQWPWTTPTPGFKVTPFFDAEYLRNGTR